MRVTLPDGSERELEDGATGADLAASIGSGLARAALAIRVVDADGADRHDGSAYDEGRIRDLAAPLHDGERVEIVTAKSDDWDSVQLIRHDAAHVLAAAVLDLYPGTKISIGPPIGEGFYYDFEFPDGVTVSEHDFEALEAKMREHIKADEPFAREDVPVADALERFMREGQDYKVELIEDLVRDQGVETVSLYTNGPFTDLCRGPHTPSTKRVKAFKLLSMAGAYWRGDAEPPDAHPRLRHRLPLQGRPRAVPAPARGGPRARPPPPRPRPRPVHVQRAEPGLAVLAAAGQGDAQPAARTCGARRTAPAATARCRRRSSTTSRCGSSPATGTCTATTCTSRTSRGTRWA